MDGSRNKQIITNYTSAVLILRIQHSVKFFYGKLSLFVCAPVSMNEF
jgi:hypothetical protein